MGVLIGLVIGIGSLLGGFLAMGGHLEVIWQPYEFVIIGGIALGAFIMGNPMSTIKDAAKGSMEALSNKVPKRKDFLGLLSLLFALMRDLRSRPRNEVEAHIDNPEESAIFQAFPTVLKNHDLTHFICDYCRIIIIGNARPHEIEALMDSEIETHHQEAHAPVAALTRLAGALPAFGIVAAVLGVVNTMGSVGQPPAVLGGMIGSALVGTFLGILLAYGFAEPLAGLLEQKVEDAGKELQCIKTTLLASMQGYAPQVAIEFGRKVLFSGDRPTFTELEGHVKKK